MAKGKKPVKEFYVELIKYTPAMAEDILNNKTGANRALSNWTVQSYADAMKNGEWRSDTAECIKFSPDDLLIDGQHRLWAIIEAQVPVYLPTAFNVPADTFHVLDRGKTRGNDSVISIARPDLSNRVAISAALNLKYRQVRKQLASNSITLPSYEVCTYLEQFPGIVHSVNHILDLRRKSQERKGMFPPSAAAFLHHEMAEKDRDLADTFWEKFYFGENLTRNDPVWALRERCVSDMVAHAKLSAAFKIAIAIKAWNATRRGRKVSLLKWLKTEPMPTIE